LLKLLEANAREVQGKTSQGVLREFVVQSTIALGVMALVLISLGWIVAGRVLRPVHHITAIARRLSQETLHQRIALKGPEDEIKELADTFDAMLARLDAAFDSQRRFVANASHELRTPLAVQRTLVEVNLADPNATAEQLRAAMEKIGGIIEESDHLISSLLTLAKSETGLEVRGPVDLAAVASDLVHGMVAEAEIRKVRMEVSLDVAVVVGDRGLLERMVRNLVENAVRYNHLEGWLKVTTGVSDGRAFLRVCNSGPRVPPDLVPSLFEPFRRLERDRTSSNGGAGLGLSIVRAVASAHGAQINVDAPGDGGLEIVVTFVTVPPELGISQGEH